MTTNDELARLRTAFAAPAMPAVSAIEAPEPEACPPPDRIWLAVRGELPPDELREIVDHIAACPACAEDWRIAMAFEEEARAVVPAPPVRTRTAAGTMRYRAWMAVAATILVAVVGLRLQQPKGPAPQPGERAAGGQQTVESLLPEGARLSRHDFVLPWKSVPEAASYNLTVGTASMTLFQKEGLTDTRCKVPESALASLEPGAKVFWNVTPVSRDGGELQDRTFEAYVTDPPQ